jgi:hypothetical protein
MTLWSPGSAVTASEGLASYAKGRLVAPTVFPALSVQLPATVVSTESGPEYVAAGVHDAIPENELPLNENATGWLYQPLESGGREGAADAVGEEVSRLTGCVELPPPEGPATVHDALVWVSCAYECGTHPDVGFPPSFGLQVQLIATMLVYQRALQAAALPPEVHVAVTV